MIDQFSCLAKANYSVSILPNSDHFDPSMYFLPFIVVPGASFLILLVFVIVLTCRDRRQARRNRLTLSDLKVFPTRKYHKADPEMARYDCCAICLEDYV